MTLKAPFPWFGGKRRVADVVWRAFGDVPNYVEPFFGSGAVLLGRPHDGKIETINDIDRYVANFWRSVQADPIEVARWADHPVNEADMHARHKWLVNQAEFRERMHADPDFFDVKVAGWWVWGLCMWIGAGWCVEPKNHKHPKLDGIGKGVHSDTAHANASAWQQRPHLTGDSSGMGVHSGEAHVPHAKRPMLTHHGRGVHSLGQMPKLSVTDGAAGIGGVVAEAARAYSPGRRPKMTDAGMGVHLPALGNDRGLNGISAPPCTEWFLALQRRRRRVRAAPEADRRARGQGDDAGACAGGLRRRPDRGGGEPGARHLRRAP